MAQNYPQRGRPKDKCYEVTVNLIATDVGKVKASSETNAIEIVDRCKFNPEEEAKGCERIYERPEMEDITGYLGVESIREVGCEVPKKKKK